MLKFVLCDDDESYLEILEHKLNIILLNKDVDFTITTTANLSELKKIISNDDTDIVFLDIMLGEINSVEWSVKNISEDVQFVFMTAYPTEAYLISAIDNSLYLIKTKTSDKLLENIVSKAISRTKNDPDITIVKSGSENISIKFNEVLFIESMDNCILLNMKDGRNLKVYQQLKNFKDKLPVNFQPSHKSYIVNMDYIDSHHPYEYILYNGTPIPIAQKKYKHVITEYKNYIISKNCNPVADK